VASRELWAGLPDAPGVYLMRDARATVLYVGRSVSLRDRVRSYWTSPDPFRAHLQPMLRRVRRIDHVVCDSLHAAAFRERELIRQHEPPFNLTYGVEAEWLLRLTCEPPSLEAVREPADDGARYFGPYLGGRPVRLAAGALRRLYIAKGDAPTVERLLRGDSAALARCTADLERKRDAAAEATLFEKASELQETIRAIGWLAQASAAAPSERGSAAADHPPPPSSTIA
jgi:excinuclease UvrABC nuclease subunit